MRHETRFCTNCATPLERITLAGEKLLLAIPETAYAP